MHWGGCICTGGGGVAWLKYVKASGSSGTQFRNCRRGGTVELPNRREMKGGALARANLSRRRGMRRTGGGLRPGLRRGGLAYARTGNGAMEGARSTPMALKRH
jgi:hypothetical protein